AAAFGANEWLVDEIYQQYLQDPNSVDRAWWDFFADYKPGAPATSAPVSSTAAPTTGTNASGTATPARPPAQAPAAKPAAAPPRRAPATAPAQAAAAATAPAPAATPAPAPAKPAAAAGKTKDGKDAEAKKEGPEQVTLRGPSAAVAKNMDASLELP